MERVVTQVFSVTLHGLDEPILEYISGAVAEQLTTCTSHDAVSIENLLCTILPPFLLNTDFVSDEMPVSRVCSSLTAKLLALAEVQTHLRATTRQHGVRVLENTQTIEEQARTEEGAADAEQLLARMWGFDKIRKTTNDELEAQQSALSARQVRKQVKLEQLTVEQSEEQAELDREWEDARFLPDLTQDNGEKDVHVPRLTINFKGKTLLSDTALKIVAGRRYGLVGKNGAGKTTLLRYISHYELEGFPRHIRIQLVEQESASKLSKEERSVLDVVLAADYERMLLLQEEKELTAKETNEGEDHSARLKEIYDRLVNIDSDTAETRARTILNGLQFPDYVVDGPAKALSGGWRMRTALAGALFMAPDLLLLDEPTNHLDLEAVIWLEHYLEKYDKQMIVVSHDRNFLNAVTTDIINLTKQKLMYYKGDYNTFENTMKENLRQQRKAYDAQQMKIQHMQEFIERFRANAKKAPLVQSRVKALEKILRNELIDEPEDERAFRMHFPPAEPLGRPIIAVEGVGFRYTPESPLLFKDVHMGIDMSSRIGILGVNGSGKSTLINIMIDKLRANEGSVTLNPRLRVATFTQHHVDSLDLSKSAVQNMKEMFPGHEPDEFRSHLGRFNLSGELAIKPTRTLSGGQKSRVGFALMTWRLPHVVVLDEPTNHLDMETIDALIDALREYKGGVVIVSHDQHFVTSVCQELWVVGDQKVARFHGSMNEYKNHVLLKKATHYLMASLRRFLQRDPPPSTAWQPKNLPLQQPTETFHAPRATHAHRGRAETAPTPQGQDDTGMAIPVPNARISSFSRRFFDRGGGRSSSSSSGSSSEGDELDGAGGLMTSTSFFRPRTMDGYTRYLEAAFMDGYLEKQSSEDPKLWKKRWFVMQDSKLFYYKSQSDVTEQKPTDEACCGVISMENIDSVTTARDFGVAAFQIRMESRRYILRAESKDMMHEWLFNFQKSIASIVSALSRTQAESRPNRLCNSLSQRQSMSRVNRSVSFDHQDYTDQFPIAASVGRASGVFFASTSFSDESTGGDGSSSSRTSPRRASSPLAFGGFGPRSPLMFALDPMDDLPEHHTPPIGRSSIVESEEESFDHDAILHLGDRQEGGGGEGKITETTTELQPMVPTSSPPVISDKYIPRYLRNRSAAEPTSPPSLSPPPEPTPAPTASRWVPRHQREGFAEMQPIESFSINSRDSFHESFNEDSSSYSTGDDVHGVTSLLGVRSAMEDVCCCIPDLNAQLMYDQPRQQRQSFYALFDGHSGVRAATFSNQRLVPYLTSHEAFMADTRLAFEECFARIDREFLQKAEEESLDDGTTAAVVLIRGNRLITANIGDSRAVVSIGGQAMDIIEEQTPGRADERERIENQGGWVDEERELQLSKLHSMDLSDPEIQQRAERVVKWVTIYRVNGELAVSRAIGDNDYKGKALSKYEYWAFPEGHDRLFHGDLVISIPECQEIEITPEFDFLILACDGLWDTIRSKEAVKFVADRLNEGYSATQASQSLANLAIRSGSSDNVSVVIVLLKTEQTPSSIDTLSRP